MDIVFAQMIGGDIQQNADIACVKAQPATHDAAARDFKHGVLDSRFPKHGLRRRGAGIVTAG